MQTDTFFYGFLKTYPHLVLALVGANADAAYRFTALEVKQKNFRFDGVLISESLTAPIWFVEVQFQRRAEFYWDFFTKVALYLSQERETRPVRLVAIFPHQGVDVAVPDFYAPQVARGWLQRVYLDEWQPAQPSWETAVLQLASIPAAETVARLAALRQELGEPQGEVLDWLQTFLIYRYPPVGLGGDRAHVYPRRPAANPFLSTGFGGGASSRPPRRRMSTVVAVDGRAVWPRGRSPAAANSSLEQRTNRGPGAVPLGVPNDRRCGSLAGFFGVG